MKALFSFVEKESGGLDILVNNAGITRDNMLLKMTGKDWDEVMDINLKSVFFCCREAAALMKDRGHGRIINLTSVTVLIPDQIRQAMIRSIPLARPGTPEDVAGLVSFLASEDSAYITGQVISCNGGLY